MPTEFQEDLRHFIFGNYYIDFKDYLSNKRNFFTMNNCKIIVKNGDPEAKHIQFNGMGTVTLDEKNMR